MGFRSGARDLKKTKSNQWWKFHHPCYVAEPAKSWGRLVWPKDGAEDPLKTSAVQTCTPQYPFVYKWREGGYKPECHNDFSHRLFKVIEKASQHNGDVILVAHCDLCFVSTGYPQYAKEFGKHDTIPHPNCPRPGVKNFPWFGQDKKFRSTDYAGKALVPVKAGTVTLKFGTTKITSDRYPTCDPVVEYWQPGWKLGESDKVDYSDL